MCYPAQRPNRLSTGCLFSEAQEKLCVCDKETKINQMIMGLSAVASAAPLAPAVAGRHARGCRGGVTASTPTASFRSSEFASGGGFERLSLGGGGTDRRVGGAPAAVQKGTVCMAGARGGKEEMRADAQGKRAPKAKPYKAPAVSAKKPKYKVR